MAAPGTLPAGDPAALMTRSRRRRSTVRRQLRGGPLLRSRPDRTLRVNRALHRWGFTVPAACEAAASLCGERTAILDDHGAFTFAELHARSGALAAALEQRGLCAGRTLAIRARNHHWLIESLIAAARLGADVLLADPREDASELSRGADGRAPIALICDPEPGTRQGASGPVLLAAGELARGEGGEPLEQLIARAARAPAPPRAGAPATLTLSERLPEGGWRHPRRAASLTAAPLSCAMPLRPRERTMICAPLSSPWGQLHLTLALRLSSTIVLRERFEPLEVLAALQEHDVSALALTAEMLAAIMALPAPTLAWYRTPALSVIALRASSLPGELAIPAMRRFGRVLYTRAGPAMITLHGSEGAARRPLAA